MRGFVDLQVNGYRGVDFSAPDLTEDAAVAALRGLISDGTAVLLPTLITAPEATYARNLPFLARLLARPEFAAHAPGLHLEGPFLCPREGAAGAHRPDWMQAADPALLDRLQAWAGGRIRLLTVAADLPDVAALIGHARRLGIVVSLGHHLADGDDLARAAVAGATALTHLGNGMPHQVERHRNPLLAGLAEDALTGMLIGDGHHLPWPLLKVMLRAKGLERCLLVSDASPVAGLPPGRHPYPCLGTDAVISASGRVEHPQSGYLMGSSSTIRLVVNATRAALGLSDADCRRLAVDNPLRLIGATADIAWLPRDAAGSFLPVEG